MGGEGEVRWGDCPISPPPFMAGRMVEVSRGEEGAERA